MSKLFTQEQYEHAESMGVSRHTVRGRLRQGWSHEDCWKKPLQKTVACRNYDKYPQEMLELAKKRGIPKQLVRARVNKGMDIKKACTMPPLWTSKYRTWGGIRVPTEAIEHGYSIGLTYECMLQRIVHYGYAYEDACYNISLDGIKSLEEL